MSAAEELHPPPQGGCGSAWGQAEPTDEELRAIDRASRARMDPEGPSPARLSLLPGPKGVLQAVELAANSDPSAPLVFRCQGGCNTVVRTRGDWCGPCATASWKTAIKLALHAAIDAVSPEGSRAWCRRGDPDFEAAMQGTVAKPGIRRLYKALPAEKRDKRLEAAIFGVRWHHSTGSLAILGPTGIGKSVLLSALALGAIEAALEGHVDPRGDDFAAIAGIRYVSGLELAKDEKRHKLGDGESPLIRMAKRAPILILDEVGYGDEVGEISAVREIFRARYERGQPRPILFGSGCRVEELNARLGEATMRCLWGRGRIIDLHPPILARAPS